jgi:hypothetical protein
MKTFPFKSKIGISRNTWPLAIIIFVVTSIIASSPANGGELEVLGAKLSWSDKMYKSDGCSVYDFSYSNQSGEKLLRLEMQLTDPFGRKLWDSAEIGIAPNTSGTWNVKICESRFTNGLGPYIVKLIVGDYYSTQRQSTKEIMFLKIPNSSSGGSSGGAIGASPTPTVTVTAKPAPAPTVTVTTTAAPVVDPNFKNEALRLQGELNAMRTEFDALKVKVAKICKVKPKPKYC